MLLQVLVDANVAAERQLTLTGTSVLVEGELKEPPGDKKQKVELLVENIIHVGTVDAASYPIAKTKLSLEFLRSQLHLRARTNTVSFLDLILHNNLCIMTWLGLESIFITDARSTYYKDEALSLSFLCSHLHLCTQIKIHKAFRPYLSL